MDNIVLFWNRKAMELFDKHQNPGDDSRIMAVFQIAIHNTLSKVLKRYQRFDDYSPHVELKTSPIDLDLAVSAAANSVLDWGIEQLNPGIYPNRVELQHKRKMWYFEQVLKLPEGLVKDNSIKLGEETAQTIINRANEADKRPPTPIKGLSNWTPTTEPYKFRPDYYEKLKVNMNGQPMEFDKFMSDYGELVEPFCTKRGQFRSTSPLTYNSLEVLTNAYKDDLKYVKEYGVKKEFRSISANAKYTDWADAINYWSDIRSHQIWNDFALRVIEHKNSLHTFPPYGQFEIARILALLHTAMADAASATLDDIYVFNHWRPITAINYYNNRMVGTNTHFDLPWQPLLLKQPRVPEYPSGFGIIGGAAAEVLIQIFGDAIDITIPLNDYDMYDSSGFLKYAKISDAMFANAHSKIYCGWHFKKSVVDGVIQGRKIGDYIFKNYFQEPNAYIEASSSTKVTLGSRKGKLSP